MNRPSITEPEECRAKVRGMVQAFSENPWEADFFAFVRLIDAVALDYPRIGTSRRLADDPLVFAQPNFLEFAPSTLKDIRCLPERGKKAPVGRVEAYFTGLMGPNGALPLPMVDYMRARSHGTPHPDRITPSGTESVSVHRRDQSLEDFVNIFNHRFLSYFYRAWAVCRKTADFDRPENSRFSMFLGALFGLGDPTMRNRQAAPDEEFIYFAGHHANRTRHAQGLAAITGDYFGTQAVIEENAGHWVPLPDGECSMLGMTGRLSDGVVIGSMFWDRQLRFVIVLGPMRTETYERLFPEEDGLAALRSLVGFYTNRELYCSARLILHKDDFKRPELGAQGRLGLDTWLFSSVPSRHLDDLVVEIC